MRRSAVTNSVFESGNLFLQRSIALSETSKAVTLYPLSSKASVSSPKPHPTTSAELQA